MAIRRCARACAVAVARLPAVSVGEARGRALPRITVQGNRLYAGATLWRAWGMNWGLGDHAPVIGYFDDPTRERFRLLTDELGIAARLGANSMRIPLELQQVMISPTRVRARTLLALQRLLGLARSDGIYLDITGDLAWRPGRVPAWYDRLPWRARWRVQARFWVAVAHAAASSPAVLCYELTSEPIVASTPGYYYAWIGHWSFVQSIAPAQGADADLLARSWTRAMARAVRSQDDRPVTIGMLPVTTGPFAPANVWSLLDMLVVHEYPATGQDAAAASIVGAFAASGKPVLLGETFMLADDAVTQRAFLLDTIRDTVGAFEFFDGHGLDAGKPRSLADALYDASLGQFLALRSGLLTG